MPNSTYIWIQTDFFTIKANLAFTCIEFILGENLDLKSKLNQFRGLINVYFLDCKKCQLSFLRRPPKFEEITVIFLCQKKRAISSSFVVFLECMNFKLNNKFYIPVFQVIRNKPVQPHSHHPKKPL